MLDSDTSLDLFRKRSTALLQFSSHEKVKKAPFLTLIFWRLTGLSTFVGCNDRVSWLGCGCLFYVGREMLPSLGWFL